MHRRGDLGAEVGGTAGVDIERTAALTPQLVLELIAMRVRHRGMGTGLGRAPNRLRRVLIHCAQIGRVSNLRLSGGALPVQSLSGDARRDHPSRAREERPAFHTPASAGSSLSTAPGASTDTYPLWGRRRSACGHMTIRPPIIITNPPIQTQSTSGLNEIRISAASPIETPASTMYVSSRGFVMYATSVEG